jgi:DNA-binding HxlR family transcriptional regulator
MRDVEYFCPVNAVLSLLSARWTLHILHSLLGGPSRFNEIARDVGVNPRTLCDRLRALEDSGLVGRRVVSEIPPNVEYALTEKGLSLSGIVEQLAGWGRAWMKPPDSRCGERGGLPAALEPAEERRGMHDRL